MVAVIRCSPGVVGKIDCSEALKLLLSLFLSVSLSLCLPSPPRKKKKKPLLLLQDVTIGIANASFGAKSFYIS